MSSTSPSTTARPPAASALAPPDLVRLMLRNSEAFAGSYPPDLARKSDAARATHLRDLELNFGTVQEMLDGSTARRTAARRRLGLGIAGLSLVALGACGGVALGWSLASSVMSASELPRSDWRIQAVVPGAAIVRVGSQQWPLRAGDRLPNGDRVLMLDEPGQSVITESAVIKITAASRQISPPAAGASSNTPPR